ncbi:uncharacterized protein LOC110716346 [Chenopodium quinoa]|uniref:uncharacterized protein LOC110716346 n=1 Tax=Chenopodium quinoa TaxID=63459 RepID=UPI000B771D5F|nr:uncharacterized protein LOC110716346 [Chenopodium quinoa]
MAHFDEGVFLDVDQLLSEEALAELYYDEHEEMQDEDFEQYESENENMQEEEQEADNGQQRIEETNANQNMQHGADHGTQAASRKQLTLQKKREIVDAMLVTMQDGMLPKGHMKQLSIQFRVHKSTISRVFTDIKKQMAQGNKIDVRTKKYGRTGPKPREFSDEFLQSVPLYLRQTKRSYAAVLKISHVTLHNLKKKGKLITHTCSNKPALTLDYKVARLKWVLSHINPVTADEDPPFVDMNHVIHIDEKWFYLNPDKRRFYLLPGEEDPYMAQQ